MNPEKQTYSGQEANERLRAHKIPEQALMEALLPLPGPPAKKVTPDQLLAEARRHAGERGLRAWDTIGCFVRFWPGFLVDDEDFNKAREAAHAAAPEVQASWLSQWKRPEIWLAALVESLAPERFPPLLKALFREQACFDPELISAALHCALEAADWQEAHDLQKARASDRNSAPADRWALSKWPAIAEELAEILVNQGKKAGAEIAEDMLTMCNSAPGPPRQSAIAITWHQHLAARVPGEVFSALLKRALSPSMLFAKSALEGASLVAAVHADTRPDMGKRVFQTYTSMPAATWQEGLTPSPLKTQQGILSGLLGVCLRAFAQPAKQWRAAWTEKNPGAPEGWPADIAGWQHRAAACAHLEMVGILASLEDSGQQDNPPAIADHELLSSVWDAVHERLYMAAGGYHGEDASVLNALWAVCGTKSIAESRQRLCDSWINELAENFNPEAVQFRRLGSMADPA